MRQSDKRSQKRGRQPRSNQSGLTLLEMMVVITIIGLLASITTVAVMNALENARIETTRESIRVCEESLKLYALKKGRYPETSAGLKALLEAKVVEKVPADGWGRELIYLSEGDGHRLVSYGADGAPGGDGSNADIDNSKAP